MLLEGKFNDDSAACSFLLVVDVFYQSEVRENLNRCDNLEDEEEFLSLFLLTPSRDGEKQNKFAANGIFILQSRWCVSF